MTIPADSNAFVTVEKHLESVVLPGLAGDTIRRTVVDNDPVVTDELHSSSPESPAWSRRTPTQSAARMGKRIVTATP